MVNETTTAPNGLDPQHVRVVGDCLVWTGPTTDGYGRVYANGWWQRVHRVVYERLVGPIPPDKPLVLHRCRERACFTAAHLYVGDVKDRGRAATERRSAR